MLRKNNKRMPDVLDCLANLSNDEVFTPPEIANRMLDLLPQEVFESKETTFLDPFTKSGVFLREITKRLLSHQIPNYEEMSGEIDEIEKTAIQEAVKSGNLDLQDADYDEKAKKIGRDAISIHPRVGEFHEFEEKLQKELNRILKTQVFGIAITELTAQLTRRSLYCSKNAAGTYSICTEFDNEDGNIRFKSCKHVWDKKPKWIELDKKWRGGTCIFCGANSENFDRPNDLEQHAYEFIHTPNVKELFDMKFDVICGNPPYQLSTASGVEAQATPIYNKFIEQALRLQPRYLTMIVPARWMNGGFGLNSFREMMLNDKHIKTIHDYLNANDCFPGVSITGGVCYFLRDESYSGDCEIYTHRDDGKVVFSKRPLLEEGIDTFIRMPEAITILKKVRDMNESSFRDIVSQRDPFGLNYYENDGHGKRVERVFKKYTNINTPDSVKIYVQNWQKNGPSYTEKSYITTNDDAVDKFKVYISKANGAASNKAPYAVLSKPFVGEENSICGMTYLMIGPFDSEEIANNVTSYIKTKFFRFLVSLMKNTQGAYRQVYTYVPIQDFSKSWTDAELYKKYSLTKDEIDFIETLIKPMDDTSSTETEDDDKEE